MDKGKQSAGYDHRLLSLHVLGRFILAIIGTNGRGNRSNQFPSNGYPCRVYSPYSRTNVCQKKSPNSSKWQCQMNLRICAGQKTPWVQKLKLKLIWRTNLNFCEFTIFHKIVICIKKQLIFFEKAKIHLLFYYFKCELFQIYFN